MPGKFFRYKYAEGEIVTFKKKHPCGRSEWEVTGVGSEVRLKCLGCGRVMTMARESLEKATVAVRPKD